MAEPIKTPTYPKSEAKFIRVTDSTDLKTVKEGEIYTYWKPTSTRMEAFGDVNGRIIKAIKRADLVVVLLQDRFEVSDKNDFTDYIPKRQRDIESKEISKQVEKAEEARENSFSESHPPPKMKPLTYKGAQGPKTQSIPSSFGKYGKTSGSRIKNKSNKSSKKIDLDKVPSYSDLTDSEIKELYSCYYHWWKGSAEGLSDSFLSKGSDEIKDNFDDFIYDGLVKKNVGNEEVPSLAILKKLIPIKNNRSLLLYYERILNKRSGKTEDGQQSSRFKDSMKAAFKAMPNSFKLAGIVGLKAIKLGLKGGSSLSSSLSSLLSMKKEKEVSEENKNESSSEKIKKESSDETPTVFRSDRNKKYTTEEPSIPNVFRSGRNKDSIHESTNAEKNEKIKSSILSVKEDKKSIKLLSDILAAIKKLVLPKIISKEDISVKDASNIEGKDVRDTGTKHIETVSRKTEEKELTEKKPKSKSKSGIGSLIPPVVEALGGGALLLGLKNGIKSIFSKGKSAIGKGISSAGKAEAVGAAEAAGSGVASALATAAVTALAAHFVDEGMGLLGVGKDKNGNDLTINEKQDDLNWKKASTLEKIESAVPRGIEKIGSLFLGNTAREARSQRIKEETEYLKNKEKNNSNIDVKPKTTSTQVDKAAIKKDEMVSSKEENKTKQIVDASKKSNTTIVQQGGSSSMRITPRTSNSIFRIYLENRERFS